MRAYHGYAGFRRPIDIVSDTVLSEDQKAETLLHWKRAVERLASFGPDMEREAYSNLTMELADALADIDTSSSKPHMSLWRTSKSIKS
jgi:phytoene/squalene synthetase